MGRLFSEFFLAILLVGTLGVAFNASLSGASSVTITVPDDYTTIQAAIANANAGDLIFVRQGVYLENIVLNKSVSLVGQDRKNTIIEASGGGTGVEITSDNVVLSNFTVRGAGDFGVWVKSSDNLIQSNILADDHEGVYLDGRESHVERNTVRDNDALNNSDCGILLWVSFNNTIASNIVVSNYFGIYLFQNSSSNLLIENECVNNSDAGVLLSVGSSENRVTGNDISRNGLTGGAYTSGIVIDVNSNGNRLIGNNVTNNQRGMWQSYQTDHNTLYHNSFVNNSVQVASGVPVSNIWDNGYPSGGNYWSNYLGTDAKSGQYQNLTGSDGIGDTPYIIDGDNVDHYPLMKPFIPILGDLNGDGQVDIRDIARPARAFGSYPGHARWDPAADLNRDGIIDLKDIAQIAKNFGRTL